jgi:hypothetical protein
MITFIQIIQRLITDLVGLVILLLRPRQVIEAENLVLRHQLSFRWNCVK